MPPLKAHSPLPWYTGCNEADWTSEIVNSESRIASCEGTLEQAEANAAFIVEAVNSFDRLTAENAKLRAALDKIACALADMETSPDFNRGDLTKYLNSTYQLAKEALNDK